MFGNLRSRLLHAIINLFIPRNSEFWTGPMNVVVMFLMRFVPADLAPQILGPLKAFLLALLTYATGRFISKAAKGPPPLG